MAQQRRTQHIESKGVKQWELLNSLTSGQKRKRRRMGRSGTEFIAIDMVHLLLRACARAEEEST